MGRSDGKLVKDIPAFDKLIPHIMSRRYDATNFGKVEFDMTNLYKTLRELRAQGHRVGVMDAVITSFALLLQSTPELNRFIVNKKIYQRNHICVSFALIKVTDEGEILETAVKVYIEPEDTLLEISEKIRETIKENEAPQSNNAVDRFANRLMSLPLVPGFFVRLVKLMDRYGMLPKSIIKLSPFHTTLFISNLASIQMNYVYHHLYDFGTTSVFITLGKPRRVPTGKEGKAKRMMTLGVSLDERICKGAVWAKGLFDFKRALENPELLMGKQIKEEKSGEAS